MGVNFQRRGDNGDCLALLYADDLVLQGESEDLRVMIGCFVKECTRRDLKVNTGKSKVTIMGGYYYCYY